MDRKLKMLPVVFMLVAGAITGIITYLLQYEGKNALLILLVTAAAIIVGEYLFPISF